MIPKSGHRFSDKIMRKEHNMGQVNTTIAGRQFRLACEDGQEDHLQTLAKDIDQRIIDLRAKFGEIGDTRLTVMAALMVADELSEALRKTRRLEEDVAALQDARVVASDRAKAASDAVVGAFNSAAERLEKITRKLNQSLGNGVAHRVSEPVGAKRDRNAHPRQFRAPDDHGHDRRRGAGGPPGRSRDCVAVR